MCEMFARPLTAFHSALVRRDASNPCHALTCPPPIHKTRLGEGGRILFHFRMTLVRMCCRVLQSVVGSGRVVQGGAAVPSLSLSCSLSVALSLTHMLSLSQPPPFLSPPLTLTLSLLLTLSLSLALSLSRTYSLTLVSSLSLTHSLSRSCALSCSSLSCARSHARSRPLSHMMTYNDI